MTIPKAVSPSVKTPGLYLEVNLLAGVSGAGTGVLRVALISPKASTGDLTNDAEVRTLGGEDSAATAFGTGAPGHLAAQILYAIYPSLQLDVISPTPGATAASLTTTLAGAPATNNVIDVDLMGRTFEVPWLVGETASDARDNVVAAILQRTSTLACTAAAGGAGVFTTTAKVTGNGGNDIRARFTLRNGTTGTETIEASTFQAANLAGGTTDPDIATALSLLVGREYHYILADLSNTDVANVGSANNVSKIVTHINSLNTGLGAKLQQVMAGYTGSISTAIASTVNANSFGNATFGQMPYCLNGRSLPIEFAAWECADKLKAVSIDPAANRIGNLTSGLVGAYDIIADTPTGTELETLLNNGVTPFSYTAQGSLYVVRPITTHSQDTTGAPDYRLLDISAVDGSYIVSRDIRDNLPLAFPNAKIVSDLPEGADGPPPGVVEMRDIQAWLIGRLKEWPGVIDFAKLDDEIAAGNLIVQQDESDPTQVNIVLPHSIIPPLAKFGVVAERRPN